MLVVIILSTFEEDFKSEIGIHLGEVLKSRGLADFIRTAKTKG